MSQRNFFDQFSKHWWSESGSFEILHAMNSPRIHFIKDLIKKNFSTNKLHNIQTLDVGCGGGIACESLARLGATVTGIDTSEQAILVARTHAAEQNLDIEYECMSLCDVQKTYDLVTCLEVVEHVENLDFFIKSLTEKVNPGGILVISTLNRTTLSYLIGIVGAEYIFKKIPIGTHDWNHFIEPSELVNLIETCGMEIIDLKGINYSLLKRKWYLGNNLSMNYLAGFRKI